MRVSIVVRSHNEAPRLRLTLASLARQTVPAEVVVVDDGSTDGTAEVLAATPLPLTRLRHEAARGRCAASNAGAEAARGDVVLFLDGDTLAHPELAARHVAAHAEAGRWVCRGETRHLRGTRFFSDPEIGAPWPDHAARVAKMTPSEAERARVTLAQVEGDFDAIDQRSEPGVYPGAGPRRLYELEMEALERHPDCEVLWAASSGSNLSVRRDDFLRLGGFDVALSNNEHRELALRLCQDGARMRAVDGARTYHLTHRSGWRDPLVESEWEAPFWRAHPIPAVKLLPVFWASLGGGLPPAMRIESLPDLAAAARGERDLDADAARRLIPGLAPLAAA